MPRWVTVPVCLGVGLGVGLIAELGRADDSAVKTSFAPTKVNAAPAVPPPAPADPAAAAPPETHLTVVGHTAHKPRGPSDFHIHVGALSYVPRKNASDLLKLAPGILLTNEGGDGHAEQVFLRGFDARAGQDIEFTVGGVPINDVGNLHGNGHADTHFIIPEVVTSLRVHEGPFDPHQGNFAVAGSADFELGLETRGLTLKYLRGSFGTERLLALYGPKDESLHTFGAVELHRTDGFGQNRDSRRGSAIGQYEWQLGDKSLLRVTATAYATSYHTAGVLRRDDVEEGRKAFYDTYDPLQGGDVTRTSIALDYDRRGALVYRQQLFFIQRSMRLRENFTGFLLDEQTAIQQPHPQRGDLIDLNYLGFTVGARGSARHREKVLGLPQEVEAGYFVRLDRAASTQHRLQASNGVPYKIDDDLASTLANVGMFVDTAFKPLSFLTFRGGLRADLFLYDVLDQCAVQGTPKPSKTRPPGDSSCLSQQGFGDYREPVQRASSASAVFLPRGTVIFGPRQGISLSLSAGRGARSIDPQYITQDAKSPFAALTAYEGGAAYTRTFENDVSLVVRSIFFRTWVERDLIFSQTEGRNTLADATSRTGWVGAVRATGSFFDVAANLTVVRSVFEDTKLLIPYVPDLVSRVESSFFGFLPATLAGRRLRGAIGTGVTYVGRRPLPQGERSDVIFVVDATASLQWSGLELALTATNLLDRRYRLGEYNYASNFRSEPLPTLVPARHFSAGPPRAVFVTLGVTFGGDEPARGGAS